MITKRKTPLFVTLFVGIFVQLFFFSKAVGQLDHTYFGEFGITKEEIVETYGNDFKHTRFRTGESLYLYNNIREGMVVGFGFEETKYGRETVSLIVLFGRISQFPGGVEGVVRRMNSKYTYMGDNFWLVGDRVRLEITVDTDNTMMLVLTEIR